MPLAAQFKGKVKQKCHLQCWILLKWIWCMTWGYLSTPPNPYKSMGLLIHAHPGKQFHHIYIYKKNWWTKPKTNCATTCSPLDDNHHCKSVGMCLDCAHNPCIWWGRGAKQTTYLCVNIHHKVLRETKPTHDIWRAFYNK